jgi:transposase
MVLHNMFVIMVRRKGIKHVDMSGDGRGYNPTIKKHNASNVKKNNEKKKMFAYAFAFIDLKTNMYVGYGTGMRSEKEAFYSAKQMMSSLGIEVDSEENRDIHTILHSTKDKYDGELQQEMARNMERPYERHKGLSGGVL